MTAVEWWILGQLALAALILHLLPVLTRPELFFGVTVPADFRASPRGQYYIRVFRLQVWAHTVIAAAFLLFGEGQVFILSVPVSWQAFGAAVAWYVMNRIVRPHAVVPSSEREASLSPHSRMLPGSWLVWLAPYLLLGAVVVYLDMVYDDLPDPYPVHFNIKGEADRFVEKAPTVVFRSPVIGFVICATLWLTSFSMARQSRRISIHGPSGAKETRFRRLTFNILLGTQYYVAVIYAWIAVVYRIKAAMPMAHYALLAMTILPLPFVIYLSIRYGQGGSRLPDLETQTLGLSDAVPAAGAKAASEGEAIAAPSSAPIGDRTPDECWKWGQVYYNAADPSIWIEKRAGVGYTVNFARPMAWVLVGLITLGPLVVILLMRD